MTKEKTDYESKLGKIPPDHFDNDLPFEPDKVDTSKGSIYDRVMRKIKPSASKPADKE